MRTLVFLGGMFFCAIQVHAFHCIVIGGEKQDHNGAMKGDKMLQQNAKVADIPCKKFDSWKAAKAYLGSITDKKKILITFSAHGSDKGMQCNDDYASLDDVIKTVTKLGETNKVGLVLDSCYSGRNIPHYLKNVDPASKITDNLCIVTSSILNSASASRWTLFTGVSNLSNSLTRASPKDNLETVFSNTHWLSQGWISSAAWEESGFSDYFKTNDPKKVDLGVVSKYGAYSQDKIYKASAEACANPKTALPIIEKAVVDAGPRLFWDSQWRELASVLDKNLNEESKEWLKCFEKCRAIIKQYGKVSDETYRYSTRVVAKDFIEKIPVDCAEGFFTSDFSIDSTNQKILDDTWINYRVLHREKTKTDPFAKQDDNVVKQMLLEQKSLCHAVTEERYQGVFLLPFTKSHPLPSHAMRGFVTGSLQAPNFKNPIDIRRRNACRSFTFEEEHTLPSKKQTH